MTIKEKLKKYYGKDVKVICNNNEIIVGFYCIYTHAIDNEEDIASIDIEAKNGVYYEIFENEIKSIELVENIEGETNGRKGN